MKVKVKTGYVTPVIDITRIESERLFLTASHDGFVSNDDASYDDAYWYDKELDLW